MNLKQTDPQFKLRIPAGLKNFIESAAQVANRSMNAEIVSALQAAYGLAAEDDNAERARTMNSQDDYAKTAARLPRDLHAQLHSAAAESGRSFNAEMIYRLRLGLDSTPLQDLTATVARLAALMEEQAK